MSWALRLHRQGKTSESACNTGGGFLIFGIPILSVEDDPLKLFGQAAEFIFVFGFLDAVQTEM